MLTQSKLFKFLIFGILTTVFIILLEQLNILAFILKFFIALTPFYIGFFIAWIIRPLGKYIYKHSRFKLKTSNKLALLLAILLIIIFILVIIPAIIFQFISLSEQLPSLWEKFSDNIDSLIAFFNELPFPNLGYDNINEAILGYLNADSYNEAILNYFEADNYLEVLESTFTSDNLQFVGTTLFTIFTSVSNFLIGIAVAIGQIIIGFVIAFYFIDDLGRFSRKTIDFLIGKRDNNGKYILLAKDISKSTLGYFKGLLTVSTFIALFDTFWLAIIGMPGFLVLGFLAGVFNIIPYLGPILGAIPILIIAASQGLLTFILATIIVFGAQFLESNFLQPKIMSKATNLHPVTIIVGLLVFGSIFGITGMIFSTPILAAVNVALRHSKYDIHL